MDTYAHLQPPAQSSRPTRNAAIDRVKGLLTVGMVYAHTLAILGLPGADIFSGVVGLIDLVAFSGFLFCFGYGCYLAYFRPAHPLPMRRIAATAIKPLVAFLLSGLAYRLFIQHQSLDSAVLFRMITLQEIAPFSEFLLAFSLVLALTALARQPISRVLARPKLLTTLIMLCLASTLIPFIANAIYVNLFIGLGNATVFPIIPYYPIFLLGMAAARYGIISDRRVLIACIVALGALFAEAAFGGQLRRFPPSAFWVSGSLAVAYGTVLLAHTRPFGGITGRLLANIGRNVLFYLLLSNIMLFALRSLILQPVANAACVPIAVLLLIMIAFLTSLVAKH